MAAVPMRGPVSPKRSFLDATANGWTDCEADLQSACLIAASIGYQGHHAGSRVAAADLSLIQQRRGHQVAVSPRQDRRYRNPR